ncbi:unnamed protein product [Caenorhabditis nigoni]
MNISTITVSFGVGLAGDDEKEVTVHSVFEGAKSHGHKNPSPPVTSLSLLIDKVPRCTRFPVVTMTLMEKRHWSETEPIGQGANYSITFLYH